MKSAKATLLELEKTKRHFVELYRATKQAKYERRAWLMDENISRAREALRRAEREVGG
jgi:hypothetical protein